MNRAVMFSSASDEWATPQALFDALHAEFQFGIDLAATAKNTKCAAYYTKRDDALSYNWAHSRMVHRPVGFCNPPYSRGLQASFIAKAAQERRRGFTTVMLLPARTDTKAFHAHIYDAKRWRARPGVKICLLPGRLKFGGATNSAPFPSMVVIFKSRACVA